MVMCVDRGVDCLHMVQLMPVPSQNAINCCIIKSGLVLPFWYRLTQFVLEKRPLDGCSRSSTLHNVFFSSLEIEATLCLV